MGQEKFGASAEALELADQDIIIPMVGMVQSLNVSVANAQWYLYEAQRQRQALECIIQSDVFHIERRQRLSI